ncbi:hypothetical protein KO317_00860 [Candidatus Micrarchaeota archaeon]|nr:hypothetical protein [Candidatus Micrarchaeota archaeon]
MKIPNLIEITHTERKPKAPIKFMHYLSNTLKLTIAGTLLFISIARAENTPYLPLNMIKPEDIARAEHVELQEENKPPYKLDIKTIYEIDREVDEKIAICGYIDNFNISNIKNKIYNFSIQLIDGHNSVLCERALAKNDENKKIMDEIKKAIEDAEKNCNNTTKVIVLGFFNGISITIESIIVLGTVQGSFWNAEKFDF